MMQSGCFDRATCGRSSECRKKTVATFAHRRRVVQATNHSAGTTFSAFLVKLAGAISTSDVWVLVLVCKSRISYLVYGYAHVLLAFPVASFPVLMGPGAKPRYPLAFARRVRKRALVQE